jgi:short-subunit dehydrogenase
MEHHGRGLAFTTVLPAFTNTDLIAGTKGLRGVRNVEADEVALAIVRAIERPRRRVYVPGSFGVMFKALRLFPPQAAEALGRMMGTDRVFLEIDVDQRRAYERRLRS